MVRPPFAAVLGLVNSFTTMERATQWAQRDPNPGTKSHVENLLKNSHDNDELLRRYFERPGRMAFGTAGLRGPMQPGPHGMNDLTVVQATQGVAKCALQHYEGSQRPRAIIGYDHRSTSQHGYKLSSKEFALYATVVLQDAGFDVLLLQHPEQTITGITVPVFSPTPLVAYGMNYLSPCLLGIMMTASHNPKQDDGYKLYWNDGCQIRAPLDAEISNFIQQNLEPWHTDYLSKVQALDADDQAKAAFVADTLVLTEAYYSAMKHRSGGLYRGIGPIDSDKAPNIAYTAMHGVGTPWTSKAFHEFQLPPLHLISEQSLYPDPTFPTVSYPNPEEKGALNMAMDYVLQQNDNKPWIVLANDPDADRLAVAEYDPITNNWRVFTGDEIGVMLGFWIWTQIGSKLPTGETVAMCASTVSSKMLGAIAAKEGFVFEDTLTGFKYIGSHSDILRQTKGYKVLFGYEEAIGYCCGDGFVKDKDGVTAAAVFGELVYHTYLHDNQTLSQHMQQLYDRYGEFVASNGYYICHDPIIIHKILNRIRNNGNYMQNVAGYATASIRDLGYPGYDSTTDDLKPTLPTSASSPLLTLRFENGCVLQMRASGTEPKFKYYMELRGQAGVNRSRVEADLSIMKKLVLEELFQPALNGLKEP